MQLPIAWDESAPTQYREFCDREPAACQLTGPSIVEWDIRRHQTLHDVNGRVNEEVEFVTDMDNLGVEENWSLPANCRGDCEDFALLKRERLVELGWPRGALTIAFAFHETQAFPHAVLLAETTRGTWVLDNLYDEVRCWDAVPYRYTRREQPDGRWSRFAQ